MILSLAIVGSTIVVVGGAVGWYYLRTRLVEAEAAIEEEVSELDGPTDAGLPELDSSLTDLIKVWRHNKKSQKLARRGYVRWYKIGANFSRPRWVKPEKEGSGERRLREDGEIYYFPEDSMKTDAKTGAWTAVHVDGEANPINLRDPGRPGMDADRAEELLQLEAESDAPGLLSAVDGDTMMYAAIGLVLLLAAGSQIL